MALDGSKRVLAVQVRRVGDGTDSSRRRSCAAWITSRADAAAWLFVVESEAIDGGRSCLDRHAIGRNNHDFTSHSQHQLTQIVEHVVHVWAIQRAEGDSAALAFNSTRNDAVSFDKDCGDSAGNSARRDVREALFPAIRPSSGAEPFHELRVERDIEVRRPATHARTALRTTVHRD